MKKYEATFILRPEEEVFKQSKEYLIKEMDKANIKILNNVDMGEIKLAYDIKKSKKGHYLFYELEAPPESLNNLKKVLKIKPDILKYLFINVDKKCKSLKEV